LDNKALHAADRNRATIPLGCGLLLLFGSALQYLAWQYDLEWLRRPIPIFPAIFPWTVTGFLTTSLVLLLLALTLRTGAAKCEVIAKAVGVIIALVSLVFILEYVFGKPLSTFDTLLFRQLLHKAGGSYPGRPAPETCITFFVLAVAVLVFDGKGKRRIEAFQVLVALAMFLP
jgi:hypothetical protein